MKNETSSIVALTTLALGLVAYGIYIFFAQEKQKRQNKSQASGKSIQTKKLNETYKDNSDTASFSSHSSSSAQSSETRSNILAVSQSNDASLTEEQVQVLMTAVSGQDERLKILSLQTISNRAAFSSNHRILHSSGCIRRLNALLKSYGIALKIAAVNKSATSQNAGCHWENADNSFNAEVVEWTMRSINNLAMTDKPQHLSAFEDSLDSLLYLSVSQQCSDKIRITALEALTNLSVTPVYHMKYIKSSTYMSEIIDNAFNRVLTSWSSNTGNESLIQRSVQSTRLLVNLSCSSQCLASLLDYEGMGGLLDRILESDKENNLCPDSLLLRYLHLLCNIVNTSLGKSWIEKTASNESRTGQNINSKLLKRCKNLSAHENESIHEVAAALLNVLTCEHES